MRAEYRETLQKQAAAIRCRWLFVGQHAMLQRRIGDDATGFWLTVAGVSLAGASDEETQYLPCAAWVAVLAGELTLRQAAVAVVVVAMQGDS